ncbi:MAG: tetratricopeptide repeat protein [Prolixibacteraceae bacterium]|nr:tetratricopeptide repeat protein [Prolixibacteraceae bacterium]
MSRTITLICALSFLASCSDRYIKKELDLLYSGEVSPRGITLTYPYDSTIFPPEIPAPLFIWNDTTAGSSKWNVFISSEEGKVLISSTCKMKSWRPEFSEWDKIKKLNRNGNFTFTVIANKSEKKYFPSATIDFSISKDSVGADIFYRAVTLPFSYAVKNVNTIEWYMGNVSGSRPRKMLDNIPVCGNCHSFPIEKPLLSMDVDYGNDKGSYVIADINDTCFLKTDDIITWSDYKREDNEPTFGLLSQISPDGNFVLSTIKDLSVFVAVDDNLAYSQLFFPIKGIVGVYNRKEKAFDALKGADDKKFVQSNPVWSPNGEKVVFARTEAYVNEKVRKAGRALLSLNDVKEFSSGEKQFKYDLYSIDFNDGQGSLAAPLEGASNNGKSNYFPKFSPDGKWIVFCQAENFMLLQPDSRLYIIPSEGGDPRLMRCNMEEMNSWHSWSPNSRWLVFSSKNRGLYTQLYLTHIDENGMDSPPVLLENLCFDKRAANIPEFYPFDSDHFINVKDCFSNTPDYFFRTASEAIANKYYKRAIDNLNKALETDSLHLESYFKRILLNAILQQSNSKQDLADKKKALKIVLDSLSENPGNKYFISTKITLLSNMGKYEEALEEAEQAVNVFPEYYKFYKLLSLLYRKSSKYKEAIKCYRKMMELNPREKVVLNNLIAIAWMNLNQYDNALQTVNQLIKEYPDDFGLFYTRAQILLKKKNFISAKKDIDYIVSSDSSNYKYQELLAQYYHIQGNNRLYYFQNAKILRLLRTIYDENNEDVETLFEMASLYMSLNDMKNAEANYNLILKNFPGNYLALKQKAKIKLNMQLWNEAISLYDRLEENYLPEVEFFNNKAIAFIQIGNYLKALEYFNRTIELDPENKNAVYNRDKLNTMLAK